MGRSDLFFLAGAITFNVLVAVIPLVLLTAGAAGYFVTARFGRVGPDVVEVVLGYLPASGDVGLQELVSRILGGLVQDRTGLSIVGALILAWIATRLVATVRVVLRDLFDLEQDRGIFKGKLFDFQVVVVAGALILVNLAVNIAVRTVGAMGALYFGPEGPLARVLGVVIAQGFSLGSAWVLFFLLYRYVPARRIGFRTSVVGATFAAVGYEVLKEAFAWYVTSLADYSTAYGPLSVGAVLFFWIYYTSVVFVLGALVARTYEVRREVRMGGEVGVAGNGRRKGAVKTVAVAALGFCLAAGAAPTGAQQILAPFGGNGTESGLLDRGDGVVWAARSLEREMVLDRPLVDHDGAYVVVHLAENRVFLMEGAEVVWSAPAGTGHGFQLSGQGRDWTFTTPIGMFQVLRKEKDPVWIAPDWYYVQRNIRIPPRDHPSRRIPGTLGTTALYLGDGIAIHGTDRPELLLNPDPEARRVSHGCIRLTNEAARQLYHRVAVGTPVLIF